MRCFVARASRHIGRAEPITNRIRAFDAAPPTVLRLE